jgi:hypothetical protein
VQDAAVDLAYRVTRLPGPVAMPAAVAIAVGMVTARSQERKIRGVAVRSE